MTPAERAFRAYIEARTNIELLKFIVDRMDNSYQEQTSLQSAMNYLDNVKFAICERIMWETKTP